MPVYSDEAEFRRALFYKDAGDSDYSFRTPEEAVRCVMSDDCQDEDDGSVTISAWQDARLGESEDVVASLAEAVEERLGQHWGLDQPSEEEMSELRRSIDIVLPVLLRPLHLRNAVSVATATYSAKEVAEIVGLG